MLSQLVFVFFPSVFTVRLWKLAFLVNSTFLFTDLAEYIFLCFFIGETVVRMWALGPSIYFEASFNR
jgi:hypothetical protein